MFLSVEAANDVMADKGVEMSTDDTVGDEERMEEVVNSADTSSGVRELSTGELRSPLPFCGEGRMACRTL